MAEQTGNCVLTRLSSKVAGRLPRYDELWITVGYPKGYTFCQTGIFQGVAGAKLHLEIIAAEGDAEVFQNDQQNVNFRTDGKELRRVTVAVSPASAVAKIYQTQLVYGYRTFFSDSECFKKLRGRENISMVAIPNDGSTTDVGQFAGMAFTINFIQNLQLSGDLTDVTFLKGTHIHFNTSKNLYGNVEKTFRYIDDWLSLGNTKVTGDLSKLPLATGITAPSTRMRWSSPTGRSSQTDVPLEISVSTGPHLDFGDDVDNFLIDEAACDLSKIEYKSLPLKGTRTSASDGALAKLKAAGLTVTLNGVQL